MRRIRPRHNTLFHHRSKIVTIEMRAVAYANRLSERRGSHRPVRKQLENAFRNLQFAEILFKGLRLQKPIFANILRPWNVD